MNVYVCIYVYMYVCTQAVVPLVKGQKSTTFYYEYEGLTHQEEWKFLEINSNYALIYYCGSSNSWAYEGGLVITRYVCMYVCMYAYMHAFFLWCV